MIAEELDSLAALGFDLLQIDNESFEMIGVPADAGAKDGQKLLEDFLEQVKNDQTNLQYTSREKLAWAMATSSSIRYGQMLTEPEMNGLIHQLFQCSMPYSAKDNKPTIIRITTAHIEQQFR